MVPSASTRPAEVDATQTAERAFQSGETAGGNFPKEAVSIMARTCCEAEAELDYAAEYAKELATARAGGGFAVVEATVAAAVQAVRDAQAKVPRPGREFKAASRRRRGYRADSS